MKYKIKKRKVTKIEYYIKCPKCLKKEIKGNAESQVEWNLNKHLSKCKGRRK